MQKCGIKMVDSYVKGKLQGIWMKKQRLVHTFGSFFTFPSVIQIVIFKTK